MCRSLYWVVAGALLIGAVGHAGAQEAANGEDADFATVMGISKGDLLNIRAAASATGMTIARVPNGSLLKVAGCELVSGNLWCRVEDANDATATGWTPARYLSGYEDRAIAAAAAVAQSPETGSIMSSDMTFAKDVAKPKADAREKQVVASFYEDSTPAAEGAGLSSNEAIGDAQRAAASIVGPSSPARLGAPDAAVAPFIALPVEPGEGTSITPILAAPAEAAPAEVASVDQADVTVTPQPEMSTPVASAEAIPVPTEAQRDATVEAPAALPAPDATAGYVPIETKKVAVTRVGRDGAVAMPVGESEPEAGASAAGQGMPAATPQPDLVASAGDVSSDPVVAPGAAANGPVAAPDGAASPAGAVETAEASEDVSPFQKIASGLRGLFGSGDDAEPVDAASAASASEDAPQTELVAALPSGVPDIVEAPTASAQPAGAAGSAGEEGIGGEIPCARYLGQPMTSCRAGVVREGPRDAVVSVNWPDGGRRVIRFRDGKMEGSDSSQPFRAVREADLNLIRIGKTERFEITDALAFGD